MFHPFPLHRGWDQLGGSGECLGAGEPIVGSHPVRPTQLKNTWDFGGCEFWLLEHWNNNIAIAKKKCWVTYWMKTIQREYCSYYNYNYYIILLLSCLVYIKGISAWHDSTKIARVLWNGILRCFMTQCSKLF